MKTALKKRPDDRSNLFLAKGKSNIPRFSGIGRYLLVFGSGIIIGFLALTLYQSISRDTTNHLLAAAPSQIDIGGNNEDNNLTLDSLLRISDDELAQLNLARINLLCAEGLPGAEKLDVVKCLATLDKWAERVRVETEKYLPRFYRNPAEYNHSEGYFRMLALITVLQQSWPHKITEQDIRACRYLKSLTPKEELALFLATRGHCLEAIGQLPQAQLAYTHAHRLAPDSVQYLGFLAQAVQTELSQARKALNIKQGD